MPFKITSLDGVPSNPDVNIFFSGQMLLRAADDGTSCDVGVNPLAANHVLTIETRTKVLGQDGVVKSDVIRMRHVGPLNFRQNEGMLIQVVNAEVSPAAWSCIRRLDHIPVHENDFRWILNLEGQDFHKKPLHPAVLPYTQHVVRLQGGEFFFRTAMRSSGRFDYLRTGGGQADQRFTMIGAVASASVFFTAEEEAVKLSWHGLTREGDNTVTLPKRENTTHEIYINNTPLFVDLPEDTSDPGLEQFDELAEYYKIISTQEVSQDMRFKLVPVNPVEPRKGQSGTPDIPCQVMMLDGPST